MIRRTLGWEKRFSSFLFERSKMQFSWGTNDCALFPADAVLVMTGVDLAAGHRGYTTKEEADVLLEQAGGLEKYFTTAMGFEPHDNPRLGRRGDPAIAMLPLGPTGCIIDDSGERLVCVAIEKGLHRLPLRCAALIWSF